MSEGPFHALRKRHNPNFCDLELGEHQVYFCVQYVNVRVQSMKFCMSKALEWPHRHIVLTPRWMSSANAAARTQTRDTHARTHTHISPPSMNHSFARSSPFCLVGFFFPSSFIFSLSLSPSVSLCYSPPPFFAPGSTLGGVVTGESAVYYYCCFT